MFQINENVIYVKGAKNGALYDLNNGNVFSINNNSCSVIDKIIDKIKLEPKEEEYKSLLLQNNLINDDYLINEYVPPQVSNIPKLAWLEITQACNCKCLHCYEGDKHIRSTKQLTLKQWYSCIDQIKEIGVERIVIIGGEPCIHKDIAQIARYVASKGFDTTIFTNGTILSEDLKKAIIETKTKLKISLYGHNESIHDKITQMPGSFKKLMSTIKYFKSHGVKINLSIVIMKENERYYNEIKMFVENLHIDGYKIDVIREVFSGTQSLHVPTNYEIISSVMRKSPKFAPVNIEQFSNAYYHNTCWNGKFVITEDGKVLPCVFERNIVLGDVCVDRLLTILNSKKTNRCWNYTFDSINICKDCEFRYACKDCRPLAMATGNSSSKNPRCSYDPYKGEWL